MDKNLFYFIFKAIFNIFQYINVSTFVDRFIEL